MVEVGVSHEPIQKETRGVMNALAEAIDAALNGKPYVLQQKRWGFALLVYPFAEGPSQDRMNYIGNGRREDVLVAIKELAARWEGRVSETETPQ